MNEKAAVRTGGEIAWAMRKGSPQLKTEVDQFIKCASAQAERKKIETLIGYFKKYGDKHDVDWLLMAAHGYQESQRNQQARSPVGAIGVM